jgi:hypothetical protein
VNTAIGVTPIISPPITPPVTIKTTTVVVDDSNIVLNCVGSWARLPITITGMGNNQTALNARVSIGEKTVGLGRSGGNLKKKEMGQAQTQGRK